MKKFERVFVIVLDSFGIGAAPDAELFGDAKANTLESIYTSEKFNAPNLKRLGLFNIEGVRCGSAEKNPIGAHARMSECSMGKDTTVGHWELMGLVSNKPLPTYKKGFPKEIIEEFEKRCGRGTLCNAPYSGTEVIRDYGKEHIKTGKLIVYTSEDSVFQIAAHEDIVPPSLLYEYCLIARELLAGEHAVGRVIARPFITAGDGFKRTENRRDFSLVPPRKTALDAIKGAGLEVISIGKISDIFAAQGITRSIKSKKNSEGIELTLKMMTEGFKGLCFTNLVDFDMLYGHRQDKDGYANAISEFDLSIPKLLSSLKENDLLIITADHGCDPSDDSTDHTREYVPLLIAGERVKPISLGTLDGFCAVGQLVCDALGVEYPCDGASKIADLILI